MSGAMQCVKTIRALGGRQGGKQSVLERERGMRGRPGPGKLLLLKNHSYSFPWTGGRKSVLGLKLRNLGWHWVTNG